MADGLFCVIPTNSMWSSIRTTKHRNLQYFKSGCDKRLLVTAHLRKTSSSVVTDAPHDSMPSSCIRASSWLNNSSNLRPCLHLCTPIAIKLPSSSIMHADNRLFYCALTCASFHAAARRKVLLRRWTRDQRQGRTLWRARWQLPRHNLASSPCSCDSLRLQRFGILKLCIKFSL